MASLGNPVAISNHLNAIARELWLPDFINNVYVANPTVDRFYQRRQIKKGGQGVSWRFFDEAGMMGFTYVPFATFSIKPQQFVKGAYLAYCDFVLPIAISILEMAKASDEDDMIDIVEERVDYSRQGFNRMMSQLLFETNGSDAFQHPDLPEETIIPGPGLPTIIGEDREYAGWNSTTYTNLDSYVRTLAAGVIWADLFTRTDADYLPGVLTECQNECDYDDGSKISCWTGSGLGREALQNSALRNDSRVGIDDATGVPTFDKMPMLSDRNETAGALYGINEEHMKMIVLDKLDMEFSDFLPNTSGDAQIANIKLSFLIKNRSPRTCCKITGIPTSRTFS